MALDSILFYNHDSPVLCVENCLDEKEEIQMIDKLNLMFPNQQLDSIQRIEYQIDTSTHSLSDLVFHLPSLRELVLDGSWICSFREIGSGSRALEILKAEKCNIMFLDGISIFKRLRELYLGSNHIFDLEPIFNCSSPLEVLDLQCNLVFDAIQIDHLSNLPLRSLVMSGCPISYVTSYRQYLFAKLQALQQVDHVYPTAVDLSPAINLDLNLDSMPLPLQCDLQIAQKLSQSGDAYVPLAFTKSKEVGRPLTSSLSKISKNIPFSRFLSPSRSVSARLATPERSVSRIAPPTSSSNGVVFIFYYYELGNPAMSFLLSADNSEEVFSKLTHGLAFFQSCIKTGAFLYGNPINSRRKKLSVNPTTPINRDNEPNTPMSHADSDFVKSPPLQCSSLKSPTNNFETRAAPTVIFPHPPSAIKKGARSATLRGRKLRASETAAGEDCKDC